MHVYVDEIQNEARYDMIHISFGGKVHQSKRKSNKLHKTTHHMHANLAIREREREKGRLIGNLVQKALRQLAIHNTL